VWSIHKLHGLKLSSTSRTKEQSFISILIHRVWSVSTDNAFISVCENYHIIKCRQFMAEHLCMLFVGDN
jgi:hypothetical protein